MEQITVDGKSPGKSGKSRFSIPLVCFLYLLVGAWLGHIWGANAGRPSVIDAYHVWYVERFDWTAENRHWLGVPIWKFPLDMWVYQEIIYGTKPDVLIEAGTYKGGGTLFFASIFDLMKHGRVLSIDISPYPNRPQHERITYLLGSSTSNEVIQKVKDSIRPGERVMVSLDSDHHKAHVLNELRLYSNLVTVGNYLVVEDTHLNGHPVAPGSGPGPMEAVEEFLKTNSNYIQDRSREKFGVTMFPGGWLKRVR